MPCIQSRSALSNRLEYSGRCAREKPLQDLHEDPHHEERAGAGEQATRRNPPANPLVASLLMRRRCCLPRLPLLACSSSILFQPVGVPRLQVEARYACFPPQVAAGAAGSLHPSGILPRSLCLHCSTYAAVGVLGCCDVPRGDWAYIDHSLWARYNSESLQSIHYSDDWVRGRRGSLTG